MADLACLAEFAREFPGGCPDTSLTDPLMVLGPSPPFTPDGQWRHVNEYCCRATKTDPGLMPWVRMASSP
jgi:hypothetical protein